MEEVFSFKLHDLPISTQPRKETCKNLFTLLQQVRVVHARGTPTSGKSTSGRNFSNYINEGYPEHGQTAFLVNALTKTGRDTDKWLSEQMRECSIRRTEGHHQYDSMPHLYIIIDGGQLTYDDGLFWDRLKKCGPNQTHYLILCSWGRPGKEPVQTGACSNVISNETQRIGLHHSAGEISMFFTKHEYEDAIERWTREVNMIGFRIQDVTIEYLYDLTSGHPGVTKAAFCVLYQVRSSTA